MTTDTRAILWETDLLAELADRRHGLLEQLRALGRRQLELIEQGDMTQLIQVLSVKHHLLAEVQQVEKRLDPFRTQDPKARNWRSAQVRERCAERFVESDELVREILEHEKLGELRLRQYRDEAAARLQMAHAAGHARTAYADAIVHAGRLDLSTEQ
jgi:hypothetical protein